MAEAHKTQAEMTQAELNQIWTEARKAGHALWGASDLGDSQLLRAKQPPHLVWERDGPGVPWRMS